MRGRVIDSTASPSAGREVRADAADNLENRYYDPTVKTAADGKFELKASSAPASSSSRSLRSGSTPARPRGNPTRRSPLAGRDERWGSALKINDDFKQTGPDRSSAEPDVEAVDRGRGQDALELGLRGLSTSRRLRHQTIRAARTCCGRSARRASGRSGGPAGRAAAQADDDLGRLGRVRVHQGQRCDPSDRPARPSRPRGRSARSLPPAWNATSGACTSIRTALAP